MKQYLDLLQNILDNGIQSEDRTGTGTISIFSETLKFDLAAGFPLVTTKFVNYNAVLEELFWFIRGETNINTLKSKIWNEWATEDGEVGPMYGSQWRDWPSEPKFFDNHYSCHSIDQLQEAIDRVINNPYSRRNIVSAWNVAYLPDESKSPQENVMDGKMSLAPCHKDFQFYVRRGALNLHWNQRSVDAFLGLPFNIASYATLLIMVARITGLRPGILSFHGVDIHLYNNHLEQARTQLQRVPCSLPTLDVPTYYDIDKYNVDDIKLLGYVHYPKLTGKISI